MAVNPVNPMPTPGLIPSAQTAGVQPQGPSSAPQRAGNRISPEQLKTLKDQISAMPELNDNEKIGLFTVVNALATMEVSENTPLTPEQRGVVETAIVNYSDSVKTHAAKIMDSFNPPPAPTPGDAADAPAAPVQSGNGGVMVSYAPSKPKNFFERIAAALTMLFTGKQSSADSNQMITRPLSSFEPNGGAQFPGGAQTSASGGTQGTGQGNATVSTDASSNYPVPTGDFYERSPHHDPNKFVPRFPMIAFHESGVMREQGDPYAVGAISNPSRGEDLGGKTYGVYQFESSTYADGSTSRDSSQSTLARFINSPNNPYGEQLRAAAQTHGLGSAGFDQVWKQLAATDNKRFGEAQESFMLQETESKAVDFFNRAGLSEEIRNDPAMRDLVLGTINQVGNLASSAADHLKSVAASRGRPLTAAEASQALIAFKKDNIPNWFQSSPDAQRGVRNRYEAELVAMNARYSTQDTGSMLA